MPRFMVEINRDAFARLEQDAKADRRSYQDQAGILLEQILESRADVEELVQRPAPNGAGVTTLDDPSGRQQKTLG